MRKVFIIFLLLSLSLIFRFLIFPTQSSEYQVGDRVEVTGIIWDEPKRGQFSQRFEIEGLIISVPEFPKYNFGNNVSAVGIVELNTFTTKSGEVINELIVKDPEIALLETPPLLRATVWMLERIFTTVTQILPSDEGALLLGITLGVKSEFNKELLDIFTTTGILHVVAASGGNVATLVGVVLYSSSQLLGRRGAILVTITIISWYSVLAGFDAAIIRASVMALITLIAQLVGRQSYSLFALCLTVWTMLIIEPLLLKDVGFLLSVTATAGIVLIKPVLDTVVNRPKFIKDDLTTTLAAQIGSLPILLGVFGSFAPLSILLNVLVLWSVPVIMILGLFGSLGAVIHPLIALPFLYTAYPFLVYFLETVKLTAHFIKPFTVPEFSLTLTIAYYSLCASFLLFLRRNKHD